VRLHFLRIHRLVFHFSFYFIDCEALVCFSSLHLALS
jgi:hypothetical protein